MSFRLCEIHHGSGTSPLKGRVILSARGFNGKNIVNGTLGRRFMRVFSHQFDFLDCLCHYLWLWGPVKKVASLVLAISLLIT